MAPTRKKDTSNEVTLISLTSENHVSEDGFNKTNFISEDALVREAVEEKFASPASIVKISKDTIVISLVEEEEEKKKEEEEEEKKEEEEDEDEDEVGVSVNTNKNVITLDDIEKVLDLKFVSSKIEQDPDLVHGGVDYMRLSNHNLGAYQAYQRAREQRLKSINSQTLTLNITTNDMGSELAEGLSMRRHTLSHLHQSDKSSKCDLATNNCRKLEKRRRLAEALLANLEEIKFFAGATCNVCGRDSCDGYDHYSKELPVEATTQVEPKTRAKQVTHIRYPTQFIQDNHSTSSSEPDIVLVEKKSSIESVLPLALEDDNDDEIISHLSVGYENDTPDSSDKEDVFGSLKSDEVPQESPSTFTIHIKSLELKADGLEYLEYSSRATKGFKLIYTFLMHKESIEFEINVRGISIDIDIQKLHPFSMNAIIYQYMNNCSLHIELYDIPLNPKRRENFLGNCDLCLRKLLTSVDTLKSRHLLISDKDRAAFIQNGKCTEFGHLKVDVILQTDEDFLLHLDKNVSSKRFTIDVIGTGSFTDFAERTESVQSLTWSRIKIASNARMMLIREADLVKDTSQGSLVLTAYEKGLITEADQKAFTDALQLVLVRNKALRTRQSEIDMELNDRAEWMHEELKWRLTLQEHAILSGKDPESVRWRQWRDENTSDVRFRTIMDEEIEYDPAIVITVEYLELIPTSAVMLDDAIKLLYVEYAFLTHSGLELETKSLPKTSDGMIVYDFVKRFDISIDKDNIDTQILAEHIKSNHSIKFTAVHEPIEDPEELQTCTALGSCEINLFALAQYVSNTHEEVYPLKNVKTGVQDVGFLKLKFDGVRAMRTVALTLLAPSAFKIYR